MKTSTSLRKAIAWTVFITSLVSTFVIMALPLRALDWIRLEFPPLGLAMTWVEHHVRYLDMDHFSFFLLLALAWGLITPIVRGPSVRAWWLALALPVVAILTELTQFLVPSRTPKVSDAFDDLLGAAVGWSIALVVIWLERRIASYRRVSIATKTPGDWPDRSWLVSLLRRDAGLSMPTDAAQVAVALKLASTEGVVNLAHDSLCTRQDIYSDGSMLIKTFAKSAQASTARSMWMLAQCRSISIVLSEAKIPFIWLKGVALSQWLYPHPHLRDVADVDLLLPDHASTLRAAEVLRTIGYALPNPHIAGDRVVHELLAWSEQAQLELDLHWDISNAALFAGRLSWKEMHACSIALPGVHGDALGLSRVHATLHACVHRANNVLTGRENRLRWLYDIHLLCAFLGKDEWMALVEIAENRGLADSCLSALRASTDSLGSTVPEEVVRDLTRASRREKVRTDKLNRWTYFQWATWRVLPDFRTRLHWLRQLLAPDLAHLRSRYGADGVSTVRIVLRRLTDGFARWWRYS